MKKYSDKITHFAVCYMIASFLNCFLPLVISMGTAFLVGILKETYDQHDYKGWSWKDILADVAGIGLYYITTTL